MSLVSSLNNQNYLLKQESVEILYWQGHGSNPKIGRNSLNIFTKYDSGHVGLQIGKRYVSFYPGICERQNQNLTGCNICKQNTSHLHTFKQDESSGSKPITIPLEEGLDIKKINTAIDALYAMVENGVIVWNKNGSSPLFSKRDEFTCSSMVEYLLKVGGIYKTVTNQGTSHLFRQICGYGVLFGGIGSVLWIANILKSKYNENEKRHKLKDLQHAKDDQCITLNYCKEIERSDKKIKKYSEVGWQGNESVRNLLDTPTAEIKNPANPLNDNKTKNSIINTIADIIVKFVDFSWIFSCSSSAQKTSQTEKSGDLLKLKKWHKIKEDQLNRKKEHEKDREAYKKHILSGWDFKTICAMSGIGLYASFGLAIVIYVSRSILLDTITPSDVCTLAENYNKLKPIENKRIIIEYAINLLKSQKQSTKYINNKYSQTKVFIIPKNKHQQNNLLSSIYGALHLFNLIIQNKKNNKFNYTGRD